jgi:hypothetical protein
MLADYIQSSTPSRDMKSSIPFPDFLRYNGIDPAVDVPAAEKLIAK